MKYRILYGCMMYPEILQQIWTRCRADLQELPKKKSPSQGTPLWRRIFYSRAHYPCPGQCLTRLGPSSRPRSMYHMLLFHSYYSPQLPEILPVWQQEVVFRNWPEQEQIKDKRVSQAIFSQDVKCAIKVALKLCPTHWRSVSPAVWRIIVINNVYSQNWLCLWLEI